MHAAIFNYVYTDGLTSPEALLDRYESLTGWAKGLSNAGAQVSVLQRFRYNAVLSRDEANYHFIKDRFPPRLRRWQIPTRLHHRAHALQPTIVHINGMLFPLQIAAARIILRRCAIMVQHHAESPMRGWRRGFQRWGLKGVDGFLFTTHELARPWLSSGVLSSERAIFDVMEGSTWFKSQSRLIAQSRTKMAGDPVFLWVGRLDNNKDPLTVLSGFEKVVNYTPRAKLYMVYSDGHLFSHVKTAICQSPQLKSSVVLVGRIEHSKIEAYYNSADYFVLGSHHEGSGYALAEALACGVIPIVTDIPSFRMMTNRGRIGALWSVGDADCFARVTLDLLQRPIGPQSIAAEDFFSTHLSFPAIGRQACEIYSTVLARRRGQMSK